MFVRTCDCDKSPQTLCVNGIMWMGKLILSNENRQMQLSDSVHPTAHTKYVIGVWCSVFGVRAPVNRRLTPKQYSLGVRFVWNKREGEPSATKTFVVTNWISADVESLFSARFTFHVPELGCSHSAYSNLWSNFVVVLRVDVNGIGKCDLDSPLSYRFSTTKSANQTKCEYFLTNDNDPSVSTHNGFKF